MFKEENDSEQPYNIIYGVIGSGGLEMNYDDNGWHDVGKLFTPVNNILALEVLPSDANYGWPSYATKLQLRQKDIPSNELVWDPFVLVISGMATSMENYLSPAPSTVYSPRFYYFNETEVQVEIPGQVSNMGLRSYTVYPTDNPDDVIDSKEGIGNTTQNITITLDKDITLALHYVTLP